MKNLLIATALFSTVTTAALPAQQTTSYYSDSSATQRSFIVQKDSHHLSANGDWHAIERLKTYSSTHPGSYILFADAAGLHRIDSPEKLVEADRLYEPLRELSAQQSALAAKQRPLGEQQAALGQQQSAAGQQMHSATPAEMSSIGHTQGVIGHEQGIIGRAQGDIGREQGVIGRQQGIAGRRFYSELQTMFDDCLAKHTCAVVEERAS